MSESGKSSLARVIFQSAAEPKTVVDPTDSEITDVPGAVTFRDVDELDLSLPVTRFVPVHPNDPEIWDRLYEKLYKAGGPRFTWTDEGRFAFPVSGTKPWPMTFHVTGRKRMLGHIVANTRAHNQNLEVGNNAQHVFGFAQPEKRDRDRIASNIGLPLVVLDRVYAELVEHGYFHFDRRAKELTIWNPLPPEVLRG